MKVVHLIMFLIFLLFDIAVSVLLDVIELLAFNYENDIFGLEELYRVVEVATPLKVSTICGLVMS